jgi:hypothetical protein
MIKEEYVNFETSKLLKQKGFDEITEYLYEEGKNHIIESYAKNSELLSKCYSAPTQAMAMRWLREVHNLQIQIAPITSRHNDWTFGIDRDFSPLTIDLLCFPTYEETCETAIKYCLENLI